MTAPAPLSPQDEAAEWFARVRAGNLSAEAEKQLTDWRKTNPEHDLTFARMEKMWDDLDDIKAHPDILAMREWAKGPTEQGPRWRITAGVRTAISAVAASLLVTVLGTAIFMDRDWPWHSADNARPSVYATRIGQRADAVLADGSDISLDTNSAVRVRFTPGERRIELLRGRAFFKVAKNPERPFIVSAGDLRVTALGTQFDVDYRRAVTRVTLAEGRINVREKGPDRADTLSLNMNAGYQLIASSDGMHLNKVDPRIASGWLQGRLVFNNASLSKIASELSRYSEHPIMAAPDVANRRMSAVLPVNDPSAFIASAETLGLARGRVTDQGYILSAR